MALAPDTSVGRIASGHPLVRNCVHTFDVHMCVHACIQLYVHMYLQYVHTNIRMYVHAAFKVCM